MVGAFPMGGLGPRHKVLFGEKGEHLQLFELMSHPVVVKKLHEYPELYVVEYQTQVVQGIRYRVILEDPKNSTIRYELNIWQKPYNSQVQKMPPPEIISFSQLEELDL